MISLLNVHILADSGWLQLIGIVVVFGFYLIGAIAKIWANRSRSGAEDDSDTSPAIEMAKKYVKQRQSARQTQQTNKPISEWDRRQEMRRQRLAQSHAREKTPQPELVQRMVAPEQQRPQANVIRQPQRFPEISQRIRVLQPTAKKEVKQSISVPHAVKAHSLPKKYHKKPVEVKVKTAHSFEVFLKQPGDLRSAIILKEILDKPVALREAF